MRDEEDDAIRITAIKQTKSIKRRHQGLHQEILNEIDRDEKLLGEAIKTKSEAYQQKQKIKEESRQRKIELQHKIMEELKTFKDKHRGLMKQLVGTGHRKQRVKDMSLGSDALLVEQETRQNERVAGRLIDDARKMNTMMQSIGMPLDALKNYLFGR